MHTKIYLIACPLIFLVAWSSAKNEAHIESQKIYTQPQEAALLPQEVARLDMSGQAFVQIPNPLLACSDLKEFIKHGGEYTGLKFDTLWEKSPHPDLEKLIQSKLTHLPADLAQHWGNLHTLRLPNNRLQNFPNGLVSLQYLDLSGNRISHLSDSFGALVELLELNLAHNCLDSIPSAFGNFQKLQTLTLAHNRLRKIPSGLEDLQNLQKLDLSHNRLEQMPEIVYLWAGIRSLELQNNQLRSLPLSALSGLKNTLQYLDLSNNPIPPSDQNAIQKCLPNTRIYF
jgi:Leucine-rich repeat (LRR) protein